MFIRETHGIHIGTGMDHVKHGIDDIHEIIELAISQRHPSITFIIHTPRLTKFRYDSERSTDIKFIRGDKAYFEYADKINELKEKYGHEIEILHGIELEWLGAGLGLQWNKAKVFQAGEPDFVIGSVHFSKEGIPYDGSKEESERLLQLRGGLEHYWDAYLLEIMEMIDSSHNLIQVIGHLDLPKIHQPIPEHLLNLESSSHFLARRMRTLLELISEYNLSLDVNLAGITKGCGIYPDLNILKRANKLRIPVTIGTDTHKITEFGNNYKFGINHLKNAGYTNYVSFIKTIPVKRPINEKTNEIESYNALNLGIELLNNRFDKSSRNSLPNLSFGGKYACLLDNFDNAASLGKYDAIRVRKGLKSLTIGDQVHNNYKDGTELLYSKHFDKPGVLSTLLNTLASEEINVNTVHLRSGNDGTAEAWLGLEGQETLIKNAIEFVKGTASDKFINLELSDKKSLPKSKKNSQYILEVDGVDLPIPISKYMILSIHNDSPGVLLILLSALAAKGINVQNLQLGRRGNKGFAMLGIQDKIEKIESLLSEFGDEFFELTLIKLNQFSKK